ncbi:hypothetical protein Hypma_001032, partial [Hypsizygus marmoreus]
GTLAPGHLFEQFASDNSMVSPLPKRHHFFSIFEESFEVSPPYRLMTTVFQKDWYKYAHCVHKYLGVVGPIPLTKIISHENPLIHYHGRWDASPGTWVAGSGFKLRVVNPHSLTLSLTPHATTPDFAVGVSVNYPEFCTVNASAGINVIALKFSLF